jgi:hypothetical protein
MKKLVLVLLVLAAIGTMAFAEPSYDRDDGSYEDNTPSQSTPKDAEPAPQSSSKGGGGFVSWPPVIADDFVIIGTGIGLGSTSWGYTKMGFPPVKVTADFELPIPIPITVGGMFGFRSWNYSRWYYTNWPYGYWREYSIFEIPIGIRGAYHFNFAALTDNSFIRKLDVYAVMTMGWVFVGNDYKGNQNITSYNSYFLFGINTGARYFFNDIIGLYLELGYSGFEYTSFGVSVKF